jgi:RND family efflux transporter MFP subunit
MLNRKILFALPLLLLVLLLWSCTNEESADRKDTQKLPAVEVKVLTVNASRVADQIEVMGNVQAAESAVISSRISGNISDILVAPGSYVESEEKLLQISADEISAKLLQARAQLNQALRNLEREKKLLTKKAATPEAVKSLEETQEIAQANYNEAKTMLGYTSVKAPFSGRITRKLVDVGDLATPGKPLFHIENENSVQVVTDVPEILANNIRMGMIMAISVPSASLEIEGSVAEIAPIADRQSRTVTIKLNIEKSSSLRSGQFARVTLPGKEMETLLIPRETIQLYGQMEKVFVAEDGRARLRLIRTGKNYPSGIEVLSGLAPGDSLIVSTEKVLSDGQSIIVE